MKENDGLGLPFWMGMMCLLSWPVFLAYKWKKAWMFVCLFMSVIGFTVKREKRRQERRALYPMFTGFLSYIDLQFLDQSHIERLAPDCHVS